MLTALLTEYTRAQIALERSRQLGGSLDEQLRTAITLLREQGIPSGEHRIAVHHARQQVLRMFEIELDTVPREPRTFERLQNALMELVRACSDAGGTSDGSSKPEK